MRILKILISVIVSVVISVLFFESNVWAMLLSYCLISMILISSKDKVPDWKKQKKYHVCLAVCITGGVLLIVGKEIIKCNFVVVLGAMMFATTYAGILVKDFAECCRIYNKSANDNQD